MSILSPKKKCKWCGEIKHSYEFAKFRNVCKSCKSEYHKSWKKNNPDKVRDNAAVYRERHRDSIRQKGRDYARRMYVENPEARRAATKKYRNENIEKVRASLKKWQVAHGADSCTARRSKTRANGGHIAGREWRELKKKYNYTCLRCGKREPEIKLTLDHIIPISSGGKNVIENVQPLCKSCNSAKHTADTDYR